MLMKSALNFYQQKISLKEVKNLFHDPYLNPSEIDILISNKVKIYICENKRSLNY